MKDALLIILNWYSYFFDGADPELRISIAKEKESKGDTTCTWKDIIIARWTERALK